MDCGARQERTDDQDSLDWPDHRVHVEMMVSQACQARREIQPLPDLELPDQRVSRVCLASMVSQDCQGDLDQQDLLDPWDSMVYKALRVTPDCPVLMVALVPQGYPGCQVVKVTPALVARGLGETVATLGRPDCQASQEIRVAKESPDEPSSH
jgi:hypothetical protein